MSSHVSGDHPLTASPRVRAGQPLQEVLMALAMFADEAIGCTGNREGDAYQQGVRDLAAALAGIPAMPDRLGVGGLSERGALEGFAYPLSALTLESR